MKGLSTQAEDALEELRPQLETAADGLSEAQAQEILVDEGFEPSTAKRLLDTLHNRGRVYDVDGKLYLTDAHDQSSR